MTAPRYLLVISGLIAIFLLAAISFAVLAGEHPIKNKLVDSANPVLRQSAAPIEDGDEATLKLLKEMADYLDDSITPKGGMALPQVGVSLRGFIVMIDDEPVIMINPKIELQGDKVASLEGCMSIPNTFGYVFRHDLVYVQYTDENWEEQEILLEDLEAFAAQHETDHLNGILISDNFLPNKYNDPEKGRPMLD